MAQAQGGDDAARGALGEPAFRFTCAAVRWPRSAARDEQLRELAPGLDWARVRHLAMRHRVGGLVAHAIAGAGLALDPEMDKWVAETQARIARADALTALETRRVLGALAQRGIVPIVFKGQPLARLAYGEARVKQAWDLDLLLARGEVAPAVEALAALGYRGNFPRGVSTAVLDFRHELTLQHPDDGLAVEPHWHASLIPRLPHGIGTRRAGVRIDDGQGVDTLAKEDWLPYLALHGATSLWARLKWLADFDALLAQLSDSEIETLPEVAASRGVGPAMVLALALRTRVFGPLQPPAVQEQLTRSWSLRLLLRWSEQALTAPRATIPLARVHAHRLLLASCHGRFWALALRLLASPASLQRFALPRALYWLYPLLRIVDLPFRALRRS